MSDAIKAALDAAGRSMCRERCAEMGEPACWQVRGDNGKDLPWPPDTCGCKAEAQVAIAAFLRALPDLSALPASDGLERVGIGARRSKALAAAVERAAGGGDE